MGLGLNLIRGISFYPGCLEVSLCLQWLAHAAKGDALDHRELVNAILAALAPETTLLDSTESKPVSLCEIIHLVKKESTYGEATSLIRPVLTPTIPTSNASATRKIRRTFPLKK